MPEVLPKLRALFRYVGWLGMELLYKGSFGLIGNMYGDGYKSVLLVPGLTYDVEYHAPSVRKCALMHVTIDGILRRYEDLFEFMSDWSVADDD